MIVSTGCADNRYMNVMRRVVYSLLFSALPIPYCFSQIPYGGNQSIFGTWENRERIVSFSEKDGKLHTQIVLKPFYGFFYDGIYAPDKTLNALPLALVGGEIYTEFWTAHPTGEGIFWRPENNKNDLTIDGSPIFEELAAYYTDTELKTVYKIRYWKTKADFTDEKAELRIGESVAAAQSDGTEAGGQTGENSVVPEKSTVQIDKYIQIDGTVYTCATGRRTYVRNPEKLTSLPEGARFSRSGDQDTQEAPAFAEDGSAPESTTLLVFGKPYLKPVPLTDLENEIAAHNSIVYPPRFSRFVIKEPAIFKKLEESSVEELINKKDPRTR